VIPSQTTAQLRLVDLHQVSVMSLVMPHLNLSHRQFPLKLVDQATVSAQCAMSTEMMPMPFSLPVLLLHMSPVLPMNSVESRSDNEMVKFVVFELDVRQLINAFLL
jgi:hypothetical protein